MRNLPPNQIRNIFLKYGLKHSIPWYFSNFQRHKIAGITAFFPQFFSLCSIAFVALFELRNIFFWRNLHWGYKWMRNNDKLEFSTVLNPIKITLSFTKKEQKRFSLGIYRDHDFYHSKKRMHKKSTQNSILVFFFLNEKLVYFLIKSVMCEKKKWG